MGELALQIGGMLKWAGLVLSPVLLLPLITLALGKLIAGPSGLLIRLLDPISSLSLSLSRLAALLLLLAQLTVILGRYVFGWSASWMNELVIYGFAALFMLAASGALKADAHVRVDIFRTAMSNKQKAMVDLAAYYFFFFPVCLLILWVVAGSSSFAHSWANLEGSRESDGLPIFYLFRTLIPVFAVLMVIQGVSEALKAALIIRGLRQPAPAHELEHGAA